MAEEIGQRIPVPPTHLACNYGYLSRQRVISPEGAILLVLIDSIRNKFNQPQWDEMTDFFSNLLRCDLRNLTDTQWKQIYWSKGFVSVLKEMRELFNFQSVSEAMHMFVLSSAGVTVPADYRKGSLSVELCDAGGDAFALYWSPASEERIPLDCEDLITVQGLKAELPLRYTNRDLGRSIQCPTCWKPITLARILRILNRLDYVRMLKHCLSCEARATIELACGCFYCEEHWRGGVDFLGFNVLCREHGRLDLLDSQTLWATVNSLKVRDDDFQPFPLGYTELYCKNQHINKVQATVILHGLCCLCCSCFDSACASLEADPLHYHCPLCTAPVQECDGSDLSSYYQDANRVCSKCQQQTIWLRYLRNCGHYVCLSCVRGMGEECECIKEDGECCRVKMGVGEKGPYSTMDLEMESPGYRAQEDDEDLRN